MYFVRLCIFLKKQMYFLNRFSNLFCCIVGTLLEHGKMAASFAAQLLDELMGRNRNLDPNDSKSEVTWDDDEVL